MLHAVSIPMVTKFEFFIDEITDKRKHLHLKCITQSLPTPKITFYKNGVELKDDPRLDRVDAGNLKIRNVTYDQDDGVYRCSVSNSYGESYEEKEVRIPGTYLSVENHYYYDYE